jgi:hypothetical protein
MSDDKPEIEEDKREFDSDKQISPSGGRADVPKPQDPSEDGSTDAVGQTGEPKADV